MLIIIPKWRQCQSQRHKEWRAFAMPSSDEICTGAPLTWITIATENLKRIIQWQQRNIVDIVTMDINAASL